MLAFTISCSNIDDELSEDSNFSIDDDVTFIEGSEDGKVEIVDTEGIEDVSLDDFEEDTSVSDFETSTVATSTDSGDFDEISEDFNSDVDLSIDGQGTDSLENDDDVEVALLEDEENFNDEDNWDDEFNDSDSDFEIASSDSEFDSETIAANTVINENDSSIASSDENLSLDNFEEATSTIVADGSMVETGLTSQEIVTAPVQQVYETSVEGKGIAGVDNYIPVETTTYVPAEATTYATNEVIAYTNSCEQQPYSTDYVDFVDRLALNEECGLGVCEGRPVPEKKYSKIVASKPVYTPNSRSGHNRYYYVRSCDKTPEVIAQTIFGDPSRVNELGRNIASVSSIKPGKRITYKSIIDPNDPQMKSFYDENPGVIKKYRVKPGENLASIAYKVYGDSRSWKEIALLNNLNNPDMLEVGQDLTLTYKQ